MTTPTEIIPFSLDGEGYQLTISAEGEKRKSELLATAGGVIAVTDNDTSADAQRVSRSLAALRIEVEKSRKLVKEPINKIGKLIDQTAKDFLAELGTEESRITKLVGDHATAVAREKAEAERIEREAMNVARAAREAAEAAAAATEAAKAGKLTIAEIVAVRVAEKAAEGERLRLLAERMDASATVAETKVAEGVRFAWDFEVEDIDMLFATNRALVDATPRRADILAEIKRVEAAGVNAEVFFSLTGLRVFKKPIVSSR